LILRISTQCSVLTNVVVTNPRLRLGLSWLRGGSSSEFTGGCLRQTVSARRLYYILSYILFPGRFVYCIDLINSPNPILHLRRNANHLRIGSPQVA
jgi:hypothetical protein